MIDPRLTPEPQDTSFPDLAEKLSAQFRQIETVARITTTMYPPHIRHGQVQADETGFFWVDLSFFRVMPLGRASRRSANSTGCTRQCRPYPDGGTQVFRSRQAVGRNAGSQSGHGIGCDQGIASASTHFT